ncbi:MAG: PAS domain S-box protein, partial [Desulfobacterales bacterium]|nr:PAS domain S-box protein [Desulfobacterales bacterium]
AEEALRRSETKFRGLIESSSDWIWEVNEEGVYTYASPRVETMLGYKPEEVVGKTPFHLMPPEEAARTAEIFKDLIEKGEEIVALENVNLRKDGRRVVLETSGVPFFDEAGKIAGYRGADRDVTKRKKTEEEARRRAVESSMLFSISQKLALAPPDSKKIAMILARQFVDVLGLPGVSISLHDPRDDTLRYLVDYYGPGVVRPVADNWVGKVISMSDYSDLIYVMETLAPRVVQANDPAIDPATLAYMKETNVKTIAFFPMAVRDRFIGVIELESWFEETAYPPRELELVMAMTNQAAAALESARRYETARREISERERAEEALRESEEKYRGLFETAMVGLYRTTIDEGKVLEANLAFARIVGYETVAELKEEFRASEIYVNPERRETLLELLRKNGKIDGFEVEEYRRDGARIHVEISGAVYPRHGYIEGFLIDVTERKQYEEELRRLRNYLSNIIDS